MEHFKGSLFLENTALIAVGLLCAIIVDGMNKNPGKKSWVSRTAKGVLMFSVMACIIKLAVNAATK